MIADGDDATRKLVANERRKLYATYLNGVAVAVFAVGGTGLAEGSTGMTTARLLLMLSVPLGGGALAVLVLWLNRRDPATRP